MPFKIFRPSVVAVTNLLCAEANRDDASEARQVAVDLLAEQTDLTHPDAKNQSNEWEQQYRQAVQETDNFAVIAAENLANALAASSGVLFVTPVVGAFVGDACSFAGKPDEVCRYLMNIYKQKRHREDSLYAFFYSSQ